MALRQRDPYLDNAKGILIILVVVGHLLEGVSLGSADALYKWIYLFHMPAFVFISGYLSRSFRGTPRQSMNLVTTLLIPYVIMQVLMTLEQVAQGHPFDLNLFAPTFASWYVFALAVWRLSVPVLRVIPQSIAVCIVVSIVSVTDRGLGLEFSGARLLAFLPFFAAGLMLTPQRMAAFRDMTNRLWVKVFAAAVMIMMLGAVYLEHDHIVRAWLYMYGKYDVLGLSGIQNIAVRLAVLAAASVMITAFLVLVPRRSGPFTALGRTTIYIYVLQTVIIFPLLTPIAHWPHWTPLFALLWVVAGVVLTFALGSRPVRLATQWLVDPANAFGAVRMRLDGRVRDLESS